MEQDLVKIKLTHGDNLDVLADLDDNSIDSIVTDPPYGLSFMGKKWDYDVPSIKLWKEVLRVLKPGGHLLSFGGTRTYHRMVVNIEDAGFEIRDQIMWLYGSGFPKSHNISKGIDKKAGAKREKILKPIAYPDSDCWGIPNNNSDGSQNGTSFNPQAQRVNKGAGMREHSLASSDLAKQYDGYGTALKPANEPIVMARKPLSEKTIVDNVLKWGTGGINIDGCRIGTESLTYESRLTNNKNLNDDNWSKIGNKSENKTVQGRFPANILLDEVAGEMLDEQSGDIRSRHGTKQQGQTGGGTGNTYRMTKCSIEKSRKVVDPTQNGYLGGASRFFYCAKASKSERNAGLDSSDLIWEKDTWEKQDLDLLMGNISQLSRDISGAILMADKQWNTDISGSSASEQYPKGMTYTIKTIIKLITELKTLSASQSLNIKDYIQDVIRMIEANGLSLAESAECINTLGWNTTNEKTGSLRGVVNAVLLMLLKIRDCAQSGNFHSTVKPIRLMEYLVRLVTPKNGTVLDPFMGSGTTGIAAKNEGFGFIGIEREQEYLEIAKARINE